MQYLSDLFSEYRPPEGLEPILRSAELLSAQIDAASRRVTAQLRAEQYITLAQLEALQTGIAQHYGIGRVELQPQFDLSCVEQMPTAELTEVLRHAFAPARSILAGCQWSRTDCGFAVTLRQNGKDLLQPQLHYGEEFLARRFGGQWKLTIAGSQELCPEQLQARTEQIRQEAMQNIPAAAIKEKEPKPASSCIMGRPFAPSPPPSPS